ncbi:MAG: DUF362 domain-containing protein [bacterium]|nr:DUF362 domain-containing protein [bacterium]
MERSKVVVLKTTPASVVADYGELMRRAGYREVIDPKIPTLLKLNLSWTKYYPACSSQPWQVHGVVKTMIDDGYERDRIIPIENKTVVTDPIKGAINNRWMKVLDEYGLKFTPLPDVKWVTHQFAGPLLKLHEIFPEGIEIPEMFLGKNVIHLPTVKTHGHSTTTGAIKNSFGGLLKTVRHYAHKYMHEVLVDLMIMQKELHPCIFAVMDGTVAGNGAGPRTMLPVEKDYILASSDSVAIDSVAASMMGFDPMSIPYLRMCHERGLGIADPARIEVEGEDIEGVNFGFTVKRSFVIWGDQLIRKGWLRPLEKILLHSPLVAWAPFASNVYHDIFWYPLIGMPEIRRFNRGKWGRLFESYR